MKLEQIYNAFLACDTITTDSREVEILVGRSLNVMFFALKGDNFDGNQFALAALAGGAKYAVVDDKHLAPCEGLILVDNVLATMTDLATYHRNRLTHTHLAITGSNGKTTTKELIQAVLSRKYRCYATSGNFNNHIGVPLTILRTSRDAEFSIIEMGANHLNEIASLALIAQPEYGLITNVGKAHLEGFGGGDGVKRGKGELFSYLSEHHGTVFYLLESTPICELVEEYDLVKGGVGYSIVDTVALLGDFLTVRYKDVTIKTQLVGDYNIYNVRAAIAVGEHFGVSLEDIKRALEDYMPTNNRSQLVSVGSCRIVVDAYNANPSSMDLSIKNFDRLSAEHKIMIIGGMKELGDYSSEEHIEVLKTIESMKSSDIVIYFVGSEFSEALTRYNFKMKYHWFKDAVSVAEYINNNKLTNSLVLIKGSNSNRLSSLINCF